MNIDNYDSGEGLAGAGYDRGTMVLNISRGAKNNTGMTTVVKI